MDETLFRIVYVSRNEIAGDLDAQRTEIDRILEIARRRNPALGITGALVFNTAVFGQVLEGPRDFVQATFDRIRSDERHSRVELLEESVVDSRLFARWSMAYLGTDSEEARAFGDLWDQSGFDPSRLTGDAVLDVLCLRLVEA